MTDRRPDPRDSQYLGRPTQQEVDAYHQHLSMQSPERLAKVEPVLAGYRAWIAWAERAIMTATGFDPGQKSS